MPTSGPNPPPGPLGVILAGGQSRRMGGGDKALLDLGGKTLLDHVIARFAGQCAGLVLSANGDPARFARFGLVVLADSAPGFAGPLAGVLAGMDYAAARGHRHIITVAADTPFFPADLVARLAVEGPGIVLAASRDGQGQLLRQPAFGQWPVDLREDLRAALAGGMRKVGQWAGLHDLRLAEFPATEPAQFFNINAPEDLALARGFMDRPADPSGCATLRVR